MMYNISNLPSSFMQSFNLPLTTDRDLLALKMSLDNAILQSKAQQSNLSYVPEIEMTAQSYPYVADRLF